MSAPAYRCPECLGTDLRVRVETCAILLPDGTGVDFDTDHDPEWGDESAVICNECEHGGAAATFKTPSTLHLETTR